MYKIGLNMCANLKICSVSRIIAELKMLFILNAVLTQYLNNIIISTYIVFNPGGSSTDKKFLIARSHCGVTFGTRHEFVTIQRERFPYSNAGLLQLFHY